MVVLVSELFTVVLEEPTEEPHFLVSYIQLFQAERISKCSLWVVSWPIQEVIVDFII